MTLSQTEYERIAVAVAVAAGCRPCTDHHLAAARRVGVDAAAIQAATAAAGCVAKGASARMQAHANGQAAPDSCCTGGDRIAELVSLGAALAVANDGEVGKHAGAAVKAGATADDITAVAELAEMIRGQAEQHAAAVLAAVVEPENAAAPAKACCSSAVRHQARWGL